MPLFSYSSLTFSVLFTSYPSDYITLLAFLQSCWASQIGAKLSLKSGTKFWCGTGRAEREWKSCSERISIRYRTRTRYYIQVMMEQRTRCRSLREQDDEQQKQDNCSLVAFSQLCINWLLDCVSSLNTSFPSILLNIMQNHFFLIKMMTDRQTFEKFS